MQFTTILIACLTTLNMASAHSGRNMRVVPRQEQLPGNPDPFTPDSATLAAATAMMEQARNDAADKLRGGGGEGRVLFSCGTLCTQCKDGAISQAVFSVLACGTIALGAEVLTLGVATFLEVSGFLLCEGIVTSALVTTEAGCASIVDP